MSALNIYIHRNHKNVNNLIVPTSSEIASIYRRQKTQFMKDISKNFLSQNSIINDTELNKMLDELYNNLGDIAMQVKNKIVTGGHKLSFGKSFFGIARGGTDTLFSQLDTELIHLNEYINTVENLLSHAKITFNEEKIKELVNEVLKAGVTSTSQEVKLLVQEAKLKYEGNLFSTQNQDAFQYAAHATNLKIYLELMKAIGVRYQSNGGIAEGPLQRAATNIAYAVNTVGGFLQEQVVKDAVVAAENNIDATMDSLNSAEVKIFKKGQLKNLITKKVTKTADVNFVYNVNDKEGLGTIQIQLPGVSIKKATLKSNNIMPVHIASGTPLNDVIIRSNIPNKYLNSMYNVFAQLPQTTVGKNASIFYDYISAKNILNSLVGTRTRSDHSYYLMINQKVFKISDILDKLAVGSTDIKTEMKWANTTQTAFARENQDSKWNNATAEERSMAIYNMIRTSQVNFSLLINGKLFS